MAKEHPYISVALVGTPLDGKQVASLLTGFVRNSNFSTDNLHKRVLTLGKHTLELGFYPLFHLTNETDRTSDYVFTRVFVLVVDLNQPNSLKALQETYYPEIHEPRNHKSDFATILLGIRPTAENTDETLMTQARQFAAEKNIIFMIRSLDNPASIQEFVDIAAIAGLRKQGLETPERLVIAKQCDEYLERKKAEENFIGCGVTLAQVPAEVLTDDTLRYILLLLATQITHNTRSKKNIKDTIELIISNVRFKPRTWHTQFHGLTLFSANPRYTPNKQLLPDPEPTYYKALSLSKVE